MNHKHASRRKFALLLGIALYLIALPLTVVGWFIDYDSVQPWLSIMGNVLGFAIGIWLLVVSWAFGALPNAEWRSCKKIAVFRNFLVGLLATAASGAVFIILLIAGSEIFRVVIGKMFSAE